MIRRDFFDGDFGFDVYQAADINNAGIEEFRQSDDGFSDGNPINGGGSGGFTSIPRPVRGCTDRSKVTITIRQLKMMVRVYIVDRLKNQS